MEGLFVNPVLWFLIVLFLSDVGIFFACKLKMPKWISLLLYYFVFAGGYIIFKGNNGIIQNFVVRFPFCILGYFANRYKEFPVILRVRKYAWVSLFLYPISVFLYPWKEYTYYFTLIQEILHIDAYGKLINVSVHILKWFIIPIIAIAFFCTICGLCKCITVKENCFLRIVKIIGENTIYIYILEPFIEFHIFGNTIWNGIMTFILRIVFPICIAYLLQFTPKLSKILFGQ